jgi:hypothetical protein
MGLTLADAESKRWRVQMADKTTRTVEARGFRVECGALVLVQPAGCAAAAPPIRSQSALMLGPTLRLSCGVGK